MAMVSVIIPTYNRSRLAVEAIDSVLHQTMKDVEVIVVDDGSTDDTRARIEAIADKRVRYFYKSNGGVSSARNFGLAHAGGEYVAFLDHDDYWREDFLEVTVKHLRENPDFGAVYCPITIIYPDGRRIEEYKLQDCKSGQITGELFKKSFVWTSAALFRKALWQNIGFDESLRKSTEDFDAYLRISTRAKFLFTAKTVSIRRSLPDSVSHSKGITCAKPLVLERFYFRLGGDKYISRAAAYRKMSHAWRKDAEAFRLENCRRASICLYKRAISYWPFDIRLYGGFIKACLQSRKSDKMPGWQPPEPLHDVTML